MKVMILLPSLAIQGTGGKGKLSERAGNLVISEELNPLWHPARCFWPPAYVCSGSHVLHRRPSFRSYHALYAVIIYWDTCALLYSRWPDWTSEHACASVLSL